MTLGNDMADEAIVNDAIRRAREHYAAGAIADAAIVIKQAIERTPDSHMLHVALAEAFIALGHAKEAVPVAERWCSRIRRPRRSGDWRS